MTTLLASLLILVFGAGHAPKGRPPAPQQISHSLEQEYFIRSCLDERLDTVTIIGDTVSGAAGEAVLSSLQTKLARMGVARNVNRYGKRLDPGEVDCAGGNRFSHLVGEDLSRSLILIEFYAGADRIGSARLAFHSARGCHAVVVEAGKSPHVCQALPQLRIKPRTPTVEIPVPDPPRPPPTLRPLRRTVHVSRPLFALSAIFGASAFAVHLAQVFAEPEDLSVYNSVAGTFALASSMYSVGYGVTRGRWRQETEGPLPWPVRQRYLWPGSLLLMAGVALTVVGYVYSSRDVYPVTIAAFGELWIICSTGLLSYGATASRRARARVTPAGLLVAF